MRDLKSAGIDMDDVTLQLQHEGVKSFADSYDQLIKRSKSAADALEPACQPAIIQLMQSSLHGMIDKAHRYAEEPEPGPAGPARGVGAGRQQRPHRHARRRTPEL